MTMDEGNRTPNSQQNQSGTSMNQSGQDSGQSFGQSGQDGDRNFSQAGSSFNQSGQQGQSMGRVDSVDGERIKLTRADSEDGQHHYIQCSDVAGIENDQVHLHSGARPLPGNDGS